MSKCKDVVMLHLSGRSNRKTAETLKMSRNKVGEIVAAWSDCTISAEQIENMSESAVREHLFHPSADTKRRVPDMDVIHKELQKKGVTLQILWQEYVADCEANDELYYRYSRFCDLYHEYTGTRGLTAPLHHKPGDQVMVDWAGANMRMKDPSTGRWKKLYVFVGVLPFSMYTYARACLSMDENDWINAHVSMFEFFGGVPRILTSDNTKTAIIHNHMHEDPLANRAYQEFARHYGTALLPTRVRRPKDKAAVESAVNTVTQHVIAPLRNAVFNSLLEVNDAVLELLDEINQAPFQKRSYSREYVFKEEAEALTEIPSRRFELPTWKKATVQKNCHVSVDRHYYSVPYQYVGQLADVRLTSNEVGVYIDEELICKHARAFDPLCKYVTDTEHMPAGHREYQEWNAARFVAWAEAIGPFCAQTVHAILESYEIEEQAYRTLFGLLRLPDKYTFADLNAVCREALQKTSSPKLRQIENIMRATNDDAKTAVIAQQSIAAFALTRGDEYYSNGTR